MPISSPKEFTLKECYPDDGQRILYRIKGYRTYRVGYWRRGTRTIYEDAGLKEVAAATSRIGGWMPDTTEYRSGPIFSAPSVRQQGDAR